MSSDILPKASKAIFTYFQENPDLQYSIADLASHLKKERSTISRQLKPLLKQDLLIVEKSGSFPRIIKKFWLNPKPQPNTHTQTDLHTQKLDTHTQTPTHTQSLLHTPTKDTYTKAKIHTHKQDTHTQTTPTNIELETYLKVKTYVDQQTKNLIKKHPEYFTSNSELTQLGKFETLSLFPSLDEIQTHIETSHNRTAQVWQKQIKKHNKFSTIEQIHSLILEKFMLKLQDKNQQ